MWNIIGGPQKLTNFILKFLLLSFKGKKERKPCQGTIEASFGLLSVYVIAYHELEFRFDAMWCSNSGNENWNAAHIKCYRGSHLAHGPQVPHP